MAAGPTAPKQRGKGSATAGVRYSPGWPGRDVGTSDGAEARLGCQPMGGGQGQEQGGRRLLAQKRPWVRDAPSKQVPSEAGEDLTSQQLAHSSASRLRSCARLDPSTGQTPTSRWVCGWGKFACSKDLICYAITSWGFSHMVITYKITFPE